MTIDKKNGIVRIPFPEFTKVQEAYMKYLMWLHELHYELSGHESHKYCTAKFLEEIRELKAQMTEGEIKEFHEKINFKM